MSVVIQINNYKMYKIDIVNTNICAFITNFKTLNVTSPLLLGPEK
jgi:hypothetical protein